MLIQRLLRRLATRDDRSAMLPVAWSLGVLKDAIRAKREVRAFHGKEWLVFYPQDLREVRGESEVLAYLVCGPPRLQTGQGNPPRRWVWLPVAELWGLESRAPVAGAAAGTPHDGAPPGCGERKG
jgi:hypothetical protein